MPGDGRRLDRGPADHRRRADAGRLLSALPDGRPSAARCRQRAALFDLLHPTASATSPRAIPPACRCSGMREYVRMGTAGAGHRLPQDLARARPRADRVASACRSRSTSPTIRSSAAPASMLANSQRDQGLKFELLVPVNSADKPDRLPSFNYHQDHFGTVWGIEDARRRGRPHGLRRLRHGAHRAGAVPPSRLRRRRPGRRRCAPRSGAESVMAAMRLLLARPRRPGDPGRDGRIRCTLPSATGPRPTATSISGSSCSAALGRDPPPRMALHGDAGLRGRPVHLLQDPRWRTSRPSTASSCRSCRSSTALERHVAEQLGRGRVVLVEVDGFYLPDTFGVVLPDGAHQDHHRRQPARRGRAARSATSTTPAISALEGEDFDGVFGRLPGQRGDRGSLSLCRVRQAGPAGRSGGRAGCSAAALDLLRAPSGPRARVQPGAGVEAALPGAARSAWPRAIRPSSTNTPSTPPASSGRISSCWPAIWTGSRPRARPASTRPRDAALRIAVGAKTLQFNMARAVARRRFEGVEAPLDDLAAAWDACVPALAQRLEPEPRWPGSMRRRPGRPAPATGWELASTAPGEAARPAAAWPDLAWIPAAVARDGRRGAPAAGRRASSAPSGCTTRTSGTAPRSGRSGRETLRLEGLATLAEVWLDDVRILQFRQHVPRPRG